MDELKLLSKRAIQEAIHCNTQSGSKETTLNKKYITTQTLYGQDNYKKKILERVLLHQRCCVISKLQKMKSKFLRTKYIKNSGGDITGTII
jgi:hypothetical protein